MADLVRPAAGANAAMSDVFRRIGVVVAVTGVVLAAPDGTASLWRLSSGAVEGWSRRTWVLGRRLARRPGHITGSGGVTLKRMGVSGKGYVFRWRKWLPLAGDHLQIGILHERVESLYEQVSDLRLQTDHTAEDLRKEIREAENRAIGQVRQLASELRGERSQASHVDARGLGPIALGVILTGLPDELAAVAVLGWIVVAVSAAWVVAILRGWLRDLRRALQQ